MGQSRDHLEAFRPTSRAFLEMEEKLTSLHFRQSLTCQRKGSWDP